MANYRQVHVQMWKDSWFLELSPEHKLLFIYLFSNERTSVAGIYDISLRVIEFETDLDRETITAGLDLFAEAGKAFYEDGIVWIVNLRKYNATSSIKVQERIRQDLARIPDEHPIKFRYSLFYGSESECDTSPTDSGYPIQQPEIPYPETESEHEHEHEKEHEKEHEQTTPAEKAFFSIWGPFQTEGDRKDILAVEEQIGSDATCEIIQWARRKHITDNLIQAIVSAAGKWSVQPPATAPPAPKEPVILDIDLETQPDWIR